jgi:hypothetical protein
MAAEERLEQVVDSAEYLSEGETVPSVGMQRRETLVRKVRVHLLHIVFSAQRELGRFLDANMMSESKTAVGGTLVSTSSSYMRRMKLLSKQKLAATESLE